MYLTLNQIKKHLNIDEDFCEDDCYLISLGEVAERVVEKHIDVKLSDVVDEEGQLETPLLQAMLLFVGDLYANRESVAYTSVNDIPFSYDYILSLYKDYSSGKGKI